MKRKAFSLACAMSLSFVLITGCTDYDSNNDGTHNTGLYSIRIQDKNKTAAEADRSIRSRNRELGQYQVDVTDSYGRGGTTSTGTRGGGFGTNLGIGSYSMLGADQRDENILVIGNMTIIARPAGDAKAEQLYHSARSVGGTQLFEVTDREAIRALRRVKAGINAGDSDLNRLAVDINYILQRAKPVQ